MGSIACRLLKPLKLDQAMLNRWVAATTGSRRRAIESRASSFGQAEIIFSLRSFVPSHSSIYQFNHASFRPYIRSSIRSAIHLSAHPSIRAFVQSIHWLVVLRRYINCCHYQHDHSFSQSLVRSFVRSFVHSFILSFIHSFIHSFVHSFIHVHSNAPVVHLSRILSFLLYLSKRRQTMRNRPHLYTPLFPARYP